MRVSFSVGWLAAVGLLGLALTAGPVAAAEAAAETCQAEELPLPGPSDYSSVMASDPSGRWLVGQSGRDVDGIPHTIVWHHGAVTQLDLPYERSTPGGVTKDGTIAGTGYRDGVVGFVYTPTSLVELARPVGTDSMIITGISDRGVVAGWATRMDGFGQRAYVWSVEEPDHPVELRVPHGYASAVGVSPDGHVAVQVSTNDGRYRSFVFSKRLHRTELQVPEGYDAAVGSIANGWASGFAQAVDGDPSHARPVRWNLQTGRAELVPVDFAYYLAGPVVNQDGILAGIRIRQGAWEPVRYSDRLTQLPMLGDDRAPGIAVITRRGDAAGSSAQDEFSGFEVAVRWRCR